MFTTGTRVRTAAKVNFWRVAACRPPYFLPAPNLKSQIVISSWGGARRANPYAFTEQELAMLSGILHSPRAVHVNIEIMRAFVRLRGLLAADSKLARKVDALEKKYDSQFKMVFDAIRQLMAPPEPRRRKIGFGAEK